jgi:hypothetical protein
MAAFFVVLSSSLQNSQLNLLSIIKDSHFFDAWCDFMLSEHEDAVVQALLHRLRSQRLPRALALKHKVDNGMCLNEYDIQFLKTVFSGVSQIQPLMDKRPNYQRLIAQMAHLYQLITTKALENERKQVEGSNR